MRTKTLLVAAAAALAAGVVTSQAQVYSQNIVGYVNTPTSAGVNYLLSVPFTIGVSNGANEIWPLVSGAPSLPDFSELLIWTGSSFVTYLSDSTSPTLWDDANFNPLSFSPTLPVGEGFFLSPSASVTNTFVGTVAVAVGATNSVVYPSAGVNYLVGSVIPYGGYVTNGTSASGGLALDSNNGLPDFTELLQWTGTSFVTYLSDSSSPSLWDDANFNALSAPPSIAVGQGFFLAPSAPFTWTEGLSAQ